MARRDFVALSPKIQWYKLGRESPLLFIASATFLICHLFLWPICLHEAKCYCSITQHTQSEGGTYSKICNSFIPPSLETWICICHVCCVWRCVWFVLTIFWTFSCGWRLPESLPRRLRHQQVENAAHPPHPVGSGTQFLCLLLRNSQLARQGLPIGKDGKHMHTLSEVASGFLRSLSNEVLMTDFIFHRLLFWDQGDFQSIFWVKRGTTFF